VKPWIVKPDRLLPHDTGKVHVHADPAAVGGFNDWKKKNATTDTAAAEEEADDGELGASFGLTGQPSGLRSPDAIDSDRYNVKITNEVGVRSMPPEVLSTLQYQMSLAGLYTDGYKETGALDDKTVDALQKLKKVAGREGMSDLATLTSMVRQGVTADALEEQAKAAETEAKEQVKAREAQAKSQAAANVDLSAVRTQTSRTEAMLTDPMTARETVRRVMESELGRAPDAAEYKRFVANLRDQEAGDDVSTTTSVYGRKGRLKSSSTARADDTQDVTPDVLASQMVRSGALGKERNTKMAGVDYYQAAMSVLGAGGGNL